jgi:hypothetical protein
MVNAYLPVVYNCFRVRVEVRPVRIMTVLHILHCAVDLVSDSESTSSSSLPNEYRPFSRPFGDDHSFL